MQGAAAADVESVDFGIGLEKQLCPLLEVVESTLVQWGRAGLNRRARVKMDVKDGYICCVRSDCAPGSERSRSRPGL